MIWLGERRGFLTDWVTQQWVKATGRRIRIEEHAWLNGPIGNTRLIGADFYREFAARNNLTVHSDPKSGLIADLRVVSSNNATTNTIHPSVKDFYEHTSSYELDAWSEWRGPFQLFGRALAVLFSRRLQQMNMPLSSLDSSKGMSSTVLELRDPSSGAIRYTAWVRKLHATGRIVYAGNYSIGHVPGYNAPCIKVVFPLPNGNVVVVMRPTLDTGGSLTLRSFGEVFGDPGFYLVVHGRDGVAWSRYVQSMQETIHVYPAERGEVRTDHSFRIWGREFLRLHYRMRKADKDYPEPTSKES